MARLSGALLALLIGMATAQAATIPQLAAQARAEAKKWQRDARLVQIDVGDFGFALDPSGIPDVTKAGPPGMVLLHFLSPSAPQALRISMQVKLTPEQVRLRQAHDGRITPSFYWDDRLVHVRWAGVAAVLDVSPAVPRLAPEEPMPRTLESQHLPSTETTLRTLMEFFPQGCAEQYTTWERGCQNLPSASPQIIRWECGVLVPIQHRTDEISLWLTRAGNPAWASAAVPLPWEHALISQHASAETWVWWTRLKRPQQWYYVMINAATGVPITPAGLCTVPPHGAEPSPALVQPCQQ